jgi:hypothetical protein
MGISLRDFGNFAVGAIERDKEITKEDLAIRADELASNKAFLVEQKKKKYDKELEQYYKEKEKFDTINKANEMYNLGSVDARTYAATILPITNPNWKDLDEKTKQLNISNFDGKTIDYKLIGSEEEINKQASAINQKINSETAKAIKEAKGDSFLIGKILGAKKKAEVDLLKEIEDKVKAAEAITLSEKNVNKDYVGLPVKVSNSSFDWSNDPNSDKYQSEWLKQRGKITFDFSSGDTALRFLNSTAQAGGADGLTFKFNKDDSEIEGMNGPSIAHVEAIRHMFNEIKNNDDNMIEHYNTVTKLYGNIGKTWNEETIFKKMESEIPFRVSNIKEGINNPFEKNIRLTTVVPLSIIPMGAVDAETGKAISKEQMQGVAQKMNEFIVEHAKELKANPAYKDRTLEQVATMVYEGIYRNDGLYSERFKNYAFGKPIEEKPSPSNDTESKDTNIPETKKEIVLKDGIVSSDGKTKLTWKQIEDSNQVGQLNEEQKKAYDAWKLNNKPMDVIEIDSNPMA